MLLLAVAGSAHAFEEGSAEELNARVRMCKHYVDAGARYYAMAASGAPRPVEERSNTWSEPMRQHIENDVFENVGTYTRQSAAETSGLYCLNNAMRYLHGAQD